MILGHGGDRYRYKDIKFDFSSNVVPEELNRDFLNEIKKLDYIITTYPEPDAGHLAELFKHRFGLKDESVIVLNGSVEGIYLVSEYFYGKRTAIIVPTFSEYYDAAKRFFHDVKCLFRNQLEDLDGLDLIFICNPNNPDGFCFEKKFIIDMLRRHKNTFFIIDEAYIDLSDADYSMIYELERFHNLIVIRSFTKLFSIPGVRLGFLITNKEIGKKLEHFKIPWSINSFAQTIGDYILKNYDRIKPDVAKLLRCSKNLQRRMKDFKKIKVVDSATNFFILRTSMESWKIKEIMAKRYQILIRDASNFFGLDNYTVRIASGLEHSNEILLRAFGEIFDA